MNSQSLKFALISVPQHGDDKSLCEEVNERNWRSAQDISVHSCSGPPESIPRRLVDLCKEGPYLSLFEILCY